MSAVHLSFHRSFQRPLLEPNRGSISASAVLRTGQSFSYRRLLFFPEQDSITDDPPSRREIYTLLPSLTTRDVLILNALYQYRYLDRYQVQELFFPSPRTSQRRIKWLKVHHLIHRWLALQPPGWRRHHSVLLLSIRGAFVLAACLGEHPDRFVRRSRHAQEHCLHLAHDLEVNSFFVALTAASRPLTTQGLYHWVGEESCRRVYRERGRDLTPDGWGRYLTTEGEVMFFVEWDRGTESPQRLGAKVSGYVRHFLGRRNADLHHVLFLAPGPAREVAIRKVIDQLRPSAIQRPICRFWTTNLDYLHDRGPLGEIWQSVDGEPTTRLALRTFAAQPRSARRVEDCVGKPGWWDRRPGGGEGA